MHMNDSKPQKRQHDEYAAAAYKETHFSGPLPPPEALAKYDQVVPGAAERIMQMAEKEMQHRHDTDNKTTKSIIWTTVISIVFAFLSVLILCAIVVYALYKGYSTVAGVIATGAIAAVAGIFLHRKNSDKKQ